MSASELFKGVGVGKGHVSPAVRLAARLYATGACKTKKEASAAAGLHPNYLTLLTSNNNPLVNGLIAEIDAKLAEDSLDMSALIVKLGRRAVRNMAALMEDAQSEMIRFKAAQDLADRSPETVKTQHHVVDSFHASREDVDRMIAALTESSGMAQEFAEAANGDYVRVGSPAQAPLLPAPGESEPP